MKKMTLTVVLLVCFALTVQTIAEKNRRMISKADQEDAIDGQFIVVLKPTSSNQYTSREVGAAAVERKAGAVIQKLKEEFHVDTTEHFSVGDEVIMFIDGGIDNIREAVDGVAEIESIEPNRRYVAYKSDCTEQQLTDEGTWGLDRIDQRGKVRSISSGEYRYRGHSPDDDPVYVYVVDSGIYTEHESFEGRAIWGYTSPLNDDSTPGLDADGHGTHVAGIIGSSGYGVAKDANLIVVKVLNDDGGANLEAILDGYHWVLKDHLDKIGEMGGCRPSENSRCRKAVVNMSLGTRFPTGPSYSEEVLINAMVNNGMVVVVAGGNAGEDSCDYSPSGIASAISVGATTYEDKIASFSNWGSNYGKCIDVFAPGSDIESTYNTGPTDTKIDGGTSMAAPHVSGIIANYLRTSTEIVTQRSIMRWMYRKAVVNRKTKFETREQGRTSRNKLIFQPC